MSRAKKTFVNDELPPVRPAMTPESREQQMIALAVNQAEKQLRDGTASSQIIVHYLKLATEKERLANANLIEENKLLKAKTKALEDSKNDGSLYKEAIAAFRMYTGTANKQNESQEELY